MPALLKEVAIIGANVLLNIGVNVLAQINFGTSDVDVSADADGDTDTDTDSDTALA